MWDVAIVGAGVIGCAIARELSRYQLRVTVLEAAGDVATGTSKANSGIVHAGHDAKPQSQKARFNIEGSQRFPTLSRELGFPFQQNGSLVLCFEESQLPQLAEMCQRGIENGVEGLQILDRQAVLALEPQIGHEVVGALYAPTGGICCPYEMTIALAENAAENGIVFQFYAGVSSVTHKQNGWQLETARGVVEATIVINAAGLHADTLHNMVSPTSQTIIPRAGQYLLFDKTVGHLATRTLFQLPTKMGKGVLVTPTVDGNIMAGPTAIDQVDKDDVATKQDAMTKILQASSKTLPQLSMRDVITSFVGLRAHAVENDFVVGWVEGVAGFYDVLGIESPGLTSAPAIAAHVAAEVCHRLHPAENPTFCPTRQVAPTFRSCSIVEQNAMIAENPQYGNIVCRCEMVTEAEVVAAIARGANDIDGIKRRTRAGMGRCQGGFCTPQVMMILARERAASPFAITKCGGDSYILMGECKEERSCTK